MRTALAILTLTAAPALADIDVVFREGAPKDRFTFTNSGPCDLGPTKLVLDLSDSAAGLIFDTTGSGAGVEVFQPYETVSGANILGKVSPVKDGDKRIELTVIELGAGESMAFTIDVDDTLRNSSLGQIRISNSEIAGARVTAETGGKLSSGTFDDTSRAAVQVADCTS